MVQSYLQNNFYIIIFEIKYKFCVAWSANPKEKFCVLISLITVIWFAYSYSYFEALREIFCQPKGTNPHAWSLSVCHLQLQYFQPVC
jgi:hypothetical protein